MNIALIGYRGVGKSTIASIIAEKTGLALKNLDAMIVDRAGMTIPEVVEKHGWDHFRDLESQVLQDLAQDDRQILDCGGGIIIRQKNRGLLRKTGPVIWLEASVPAIIARIKHDRQRPSLTGKSFILEVENVLAEREPLYRETASHVIRTDEMSPEQAADKVLELTGLKKH